jgi:beta-glucanase (GH16 family)
MDLQGERANHHRREPGGEQARGPATERSGRPRASRARRSRSPSARTWLGALAVVTALAACQPAPTTPNSSTTTTTTTTAPRPTTTTTRPITTTTTLPAATASGDEFAGSTLDAQRWRALSGTYGNAGGGSRHCLVSRNVTVSGGTLKILSAKAEMTCSGETLPYTSGFIASRDADRYYPLEGTFSIRARVPAAQGIWPAFWLRHRDGARVAEVDIFESFHAQAPGRATQALHLDGQTNTAQQSTWFETPSAAPGWHTFAVRIRRVAADGSANRNDIAFDFSVDGRPSLSFVDVDPAWPAAADPAATWDIAVSTAVDGRWAGNPDGVLGQLDQLRRCSMGGTYPACSSAGIRRVDWSKPVVFEVDWVRFTPLTPGG